MYVVKDHWLPVTWCFGQPYISGDHGFEHLRAEEAAQVSGNLLGQYRPVVIHRQENAFDRKRGIDRPAEAH